MEGQRLISTTMIGLKRLLVEGIRRPVGFIHFISHFPDFLRLYGRLLLDGRVPIRLKALLIGAVAYVIAPFDLLPDFVLPVIGYIDDLFVLVAGAKYFLRKCPGDVVSEHVRQIESEKVIR